MGLARGLRSSRTAANVRHQRANPQYNRQRSSRPEIWITGENVRPPAGDWCATLSFDVDPLDGQNVYFPIWWALTGVFGEAKSHFSSADMRLERLLTGRTTDISARPKFACAFVGNPDPMRMHAIQALSTIGQVDVFGPAVGLPVRDKHQIAKSYRFMICFENDLYPGYVTEKPFEAWASGCIPLWWGSDPLGQLNAAAMLNLDQLGSMRALTRKVSDLESDPDQVRMMGSLPILAKPPDFQSTIVRLRQLLPNDLIAVQARPYLA